MNIEITNITSLRLEDIAAGRHDTRKLPVTLTDDEVRAKQSEATRLTIDLATAEAAVDAEKERAKSWVKDAEARVTAIKAKSRDLAREAIAKEEWREVETREVIDRRVRKVLTVRLDTGGLVEQRSATTEELESGCEWIVTADGKQTKLTHIPTGDIVRERVTTAAERQLSLDALAPREIVWVSKGHWTHAAGDDIDDLEQPVEHAKELTWTESESGDWMRTDVPKGAVLDALMHKLGVLEWPFKVGNDAPTTIGDLTGRKAGAAGDKVTSIKGKRAAAKSGEAG